MKKGPVLDFCVENIKKFRIHLDILNIVVVKVRRPCNEFPKVDNTKFKNFVPIYVSTIIILNICMATHCICTATHLF